VCSKLVASLLQEVHEVVTHTINENSMAQPAVSLLLVGSHPVAISYAQSTIAAARYAGVALSVHDLSEAATHDEVVARIEGLNADEHCHGIVLQLPLPAHLDAGSLLAAISDEKDVDCLKESSVQRCLMRSEPTVCPCIAVACEEVLRSLDVLQRPTDRVGRPKVCPEVVLLSLPPLLALPLRLSLQAAGCRVSCLGDDVDVSSVRTELQSADVLLLGARRPEVVAAQWVRSGCVLLDLGLATSAPPIDSHAHARQQQQQKQQKQQQRRQQQQALQQQQQQQQSAGHTQPNTGHTGERPVLPTESGLSPGLERLQSPASSSETGTDVCPHGWPPGGEAAGGEAKRGSAKSSPPTERGISPNGTSAASSSAGDSLSSAGDSSGETSNGDDEAAEEGSSSPWSSPPVQCDVLCLSCSDGLTAMTGALRVRNASHIALLQQGFLEQDARGHGW